MPIIDKSDFPPLSAEFFVAEFFPDRLQDPKLGAELIAERLKGADPRIVAAVLRNRAAVLRNRAAVLRNRAVSVALSTENAVRNYPETKHVKSRS